MELAAPKEREKMIQKKKEQLEFFAEMESNIKRKLKEAAFVTFTSRDSMDTNHNNFDFDNDLSSIELTPQFASLKWEDFDVQTGEFRKGPGITGGFSGKSRSISSMDDDIIRTMRRTESNAGLNTEYFLQLNDVANDSSPYGTTRTYSNEFARNSFTLRARTTSSHSNDSDGYTFADVKSTEREMKRVDSRNLLAKQNKSCGNRSRTSSVEKAFTTSDAIAEPKNSPIQPFKRRNSTGTIYVEATMSNQNDDSTITAVCIIIRAHMILAAKEKRESAKKYDVFKDVNLINDQASSPNRTNMYVPDVVPSLNAVKEYFKNIFSRSQLESECIIMTLIYIERLIKCTTGLLCIRHDNWKSIMFSALMMSSKVWDDLSMWNIDFSQAARGFTLSHVNELEISFLDAVGYSIRVSAGEYAKYYFHLRSMMVKLGFTDYKKNGISPLNIEGARKLQLATEKYQKGHKAMRRTRSVLELPLDASKLNLEDSNSYLDENKHLYKCIVGLEQLVHDNHNDADGSKKRSFSQKAKRKTDDSSKNKNEAKIDESKSYRK